MTAFRAASEKTQPQVVSATNGRDPFISLRVRGQTKREGGVAVSVLDGASAAVFGLGVSWRRTVSWSREANVKVDLISNDVAE